jgi:hypothetical protein
MFVVPYRNPLIQFYNTGPTIETISFEFLKGSLPVAGPASVLESDKRTVPVQLVFADFLDDASTLDASFKSLTTTPLPDLSKNFDLDMDTQVLRLTFDFNWMSNFLTGDPAVSSNCCLLFVCPFVYYFDFLVVVHSAPLCVRYDAHVLFRWTIH